MELLFPVDGPLTSSQTASLLEAGLTYVLYQRGQIPLPYQQLQLSASQQKKFENENDCTTVENVSVKSISENAQSNLSGEVTPRERISAVLMERKKRLLLNKKEKQKRQSIAVESKAYNSIQPAFEILQQLLTDITQKNLGVTASGHSKKVVSMALILGPSLYCPKEVYCFDLPFVWVSDESTLISKASACKFESTILRQFYKKVITNADLMDFTSKPLGTTYAHICLVTLGDLNSIVKGNSYYKEVVRLPNIPPSLHQMLLSQFAGCGSDSVDADSSLSPRPYGFPHSRKTKANKCFKFKIHYQTQGHATNQESIEITHDSFSGDILFDNNSFSCYQIPLRFKGCKNKRL